MSRDKLEKDYKKFNESIQLEVENELKKIQQESDALKKEAVEIGEAVERSIKYNPTKRVKKKVNT
jgi:transposase-like protein